MPSCRKMITLALLVLFCGGSIGTGYAEQTGTPVYGRTELSKYITLDGVHNGAGITFFQSLIDYSSGIFESNFLWVHRCKIPPKSGIGLNLKRFMEGIYWGFNIPAEFTINDGTALLPAGASALCDMGSYQGIFNPSDSDTLEFLHTAVSHEKMPGGNLGVVDLKDNLANRTVLSPAPYAWTQLDRTLLRPVTALHGGRGTIEMRRMWAEESFESPWLAVDHVVLPPGTSIGCHRYRNGEAVYYILEGGGLFTVNEHTWRIRPGDAVPATRGDRHGVNNDTGADLELFFMTVALKKGEAPDIEDMGDDLSTRKATGTVR